MLVLSRRLNEKLLFPGLQTSIQIIGIKPGLVRLGIDAPEEVRVLREEVPDRQAEWGLPPTGPGAWPLDLAQINQMLNRRLEIARRGLNQARQLAGSQPEDASELLEKVNEDLCMLQRRLRLEVAKAGLGLEREDEEMACAGKARRPH